MVNLMDIKEAFELLKKYKIPVPRYVIIDNPQDLEGINSLKFPVALKLISKKIIHKTDEGAVMLNIASPKELEINLKEMERKFYAIEDRKYLIQEMVKKGVEVVVGGINDKIFGPVIMFGLGGIMVEIYRDVSFRLAPITKNDAAEMLSEIKGKKILDGYRTLPPVDKERLIRILVSASMLIYENSNIIEMDINPLICRNDDVKAVDIRIVLGDE
jgi:acetyl-CoA synthetase (ADP-forming)